MKNLSVLLFLICVSVTAQQLPQPDIFEKFESKFYKIDGYKEITKLNKQNHFFTRYTRNKEPTFLEETFNKWGVLHFL